MLALMRSDVLSAGWTACTNRRKYLKKLASRLLRRDGDTLNQSLLALDIRYHLD